MSAPVPLNHCSVGILSTTVYSQFKFKIKLRDLALPPKTLINWPPFSYHAILLDVIPIHRQAFITGHSGCNQCSDYISTHAGVHMP